MSSTSQNNASPPHQRFDDLPVVQTKAKLNHALSRGPTAEFGKDPMFESSRQRPTLDEDAPPTTSVNDIVNATYMDHSVGNQRKHTDFEPAASGTLISRSARLVPLPAGDFSYLIVFGYPPDKYSVAVEYFKQLGEVTEPEANTEVVNCFRVGFKNPGDALRAVRKNGEIISGSWMVGVKWADSAQGDNIFGQSLNTRGPTSAQSPGPDSSSHLSDAMAIDVDSGHPRVQLPSTPPVGTPIRLAPPSSAFKKPGTGQKSTNVQPPHMAVTPLAMGSATNSPTKGVIGQVSELIFGW